MNVYKESLRLILTTSLSDARIATQVDRAPNTIRKYRSLAKHRGLDWEVVKNIDDVSTQGLVMKGGSGLSTKRKPDWHYVYSQMQMPDVTLQMLWEEYRLDNPVDAYGYSSFTEHYRQYVSKLDLSMRQTHRAGETVFVDYAGRTIPYEPPGKSQKSAEIFVGVLGNSKLTFAYACASQKTPDWIDAHNRMYRFFGGVPAITVPDNLKSAVIRAGAEPKLNRAYKEMAVHYGTVIVPARVRRPQDKSLAEIGVQIVTRWITAALRHRKFFSLQEINDEIAERLVHLNRKPFKKLPGCRQEIYEKMDKPRLMLLPSSVFDPTSIWSSAQTVKSDYHVYVGKHYYSVPHQLVGSRIEARTTHKIVEIYSLGKRVATHVRCEVVGGCSTLPEHQPVAHRKYAEQTPEHFKSWANEIGEFTLGFVEYQLNRTSHSLSGIRVCSSLKRLCKQYGAERLEAACERAYLIGSLTLKSVKSILRRNLDAIHDPRTPVQGQLPLHYNVRGPSYYAQEG